MTNEEEASETFYSTLCMDGSEIRKADVIETPDGPGRIYGMDFEGPRWSTWGRPVVFLEVPPGARDAYLMFLEEAQEARKLSEGPRIEKEPV